MSEVDELSASGFVDDVVMLVMMVGDVTTKRAEVGTRKLFTQLIRNLWRRGMN